MSGAPARVGPPKGMPEFAAYLSEAEVAALPQGSVYEASDARGSLPYLCLSLMLNVSMKMFFFSCMIYRTRYKKQNFGQT